MSESAAISVAAVVVTHNRLQKLKKSLECIFPQKVSAIVVVDNCSTDGTAEWLTGLDDARLSVRSLPQNSGGAGGFYNGIKYAVENTGCDWVCCFDDDAYADSALIGTFLANHGTSEAAFVASAVYAADGSILEMNRPVRRLPRGPIDFIESIVRRKRYVVCDDAYRQDQTVEIAAGSMVGLFINAAKVKRRIGYPRPDLFLYCDDLIYTSAAKLAGEKLSFDANLRFFHDCTDDGSRLYRQPWKTYLLARNHIFYYKQIAPNGFRLMVAIRFIYILANLRYCDEKFHYLTCMYGGLRDGLAGDASINILDKMGQDRQIAH